MLRTSPALTVAAAALSLTAQGIPTPSAFLKLPLGADRTLADYTQMGAYLKELARLSPRIEIETLGKTTQGRDLLMAVISSPKNLKQKAHYQEIARRLADPRGLSAQEVESLTREGKAIILVTCAIHSSEIGSTQMSLEWAHSLATTQDPALLKRLDDVILLVVPSLNPDGHDMEVEWYRKHVGTSFEGASMPWLYHWYTGHDNNRDWVHLTQKEHQALSHAVYHVWNPQIWLDEHQMGQTGARMFIPPFSNPSSPAIHPLIWRQVDATATLMGWRLEQAGKAGVGYGFSFDAYWPGGTKNTAWFKNVPGLLSEVASVRLATPIEIHPSELGGNGKGLVSTQKPQVNFPNPWKGGTWRLRDIMDYQRLAADGFLEAASTFRQDLLRSRARMAQDTVAMAAPDRFWRIASDQRDPATAAKLARLMLTHKVEVLWHPGERAWLIPEAQPYGRFVREMFSVQRFPEVKLQDGGAPLEPYDITAWSLPLHMGLEVGSVKLDGSQRKALRPALPTDGPDAGLIGRGSHYALGRKSNAATPLLLAHLKAGGKAQTLRQPMATRSGSLPAGTFILQADSGLEALAKAYGLKLHAVEAPTEAQTQRIPRVGLYKPYTASMEEGWTRFVLDQAGFAPQSLFNKDVKAGGLNARFDVIVLADQRKSALLEGRSGEGIPAEYRGGIGKEGAKALQAFVEAGGTLVCMGSAGEWAAEALDLPVRNALGAKEGEGFSASGALVNIQVDPSHPVTWGMPTSTAALLNADLAWQTRPARLGQSRTILASYPTDARDILASGWIKGVEKLEGRTAAAAFACGKGRVVLFGVSVQHRAQTDATFKLLYNALLWPGLE